jgi:hypothetical protein
MSHVADNSLGKDDTQCSQQLLHSQVASLPSLFFPRNVEMYLSNHGLDILTEKKTKMFARLVLSCLHYYLTVVPQYFLTVVTGKSVFW